MKVALVYDMDACRRPTGRDAPRLAQLERLAGGPTSSCRSSRGGSASRTAWPSGRALGDIPRREMPCGPATCSALVAVHRLAAGRVVDGAGRLGVCPGRVLRPHEVGPAGRDEPRRPAGRHPRRSPAARACCSKVFGRADLILSVSAFNTAQARRALPG